MLTLSAPDGTAPTPAPPRLRARLAASPTAAAAGLAAATMAANLIAVVFTVTFTRLLGASDYGSLAALLNLSVILFVPGSALQVAVARAGTLGELGAAGELAATLRRWTLRVLAVLALVALVSALARAPLAVALDVEQEWAAAAVPVTAVLWSLLSLQRGLLQAAREYRTVGVSIVLEALGRLAVGAVLVGAGLGVAGAYVGTLASFVVVAVVLDALLRRRLGPARPRAPAPTGCAPSPAARRSRSPHSRSSPRSRTSTSSSLGTCWPTIRPVSTRRAPWRPRRSCGSPWGSGCGCCRRRSIARPRAATRGPCSPARSL